jgi:hypothetical protein
MKLFSPADYKPSRDAWGFPSVWVPIGREGVVKYDTYEKVVTMEQLLNQESLDTLVGQFLYRFHPGTVNVDNFQAYPSVGVILDTYRISEDGLGVEVLCKITDKETYTDIVNEDLTESSGGYYEESGVRVYNHIALVPTGWARGGRGMRIQLESKETYQLETMTGVTPLINMETQIGEILANQMTLVEKVNGLEQMVQGLVVAELEPEVEMESIEKEKVLFEEGYAKGIEDGQVLTIAGSHGYVGADAKEAKAFVVNKAFPSIALESFSEDFISGLYTGALTSLANPAISITPDAPATVVVQESKKATISRLPNGQ